MAGGRPTDYTEELGDLIAGLIKAGKTMQEICSLESMPCRSTYYVWLKEHPEFMDKCKQAELESADSLYQDGLKELLELPKTKCWEDANGKVFSDEEVKMLSAQEKAALGLEKIGLSSELVARGKAIYEAKKHFAAIRNPNKYSEKRRVQHEGSVDIKMFLDGLEDE